MSPDCCWIVERIHISRIGGDARPSTSPSIERNPPAAAEVDAERKPDRAQPQAMKAAELVGAGLPQLLAPLVWTSSTGCWPRMSIPIRSSICIAPAGAAIADALRKNH